MADVDGVTGQVTESDSMASIEANVTTAPEGQATEQASQEQAIADALLELDGKQFTEADIRAWQDAHNNMSKWRGELSKKGEEVNAMARALEQARQAMLNQQPQQPQSNQGGYQPVPQEQLVPVLQAAILEGNPQALQQLQGWIENLAVHGAQTTVNTATEAQQIRQKFLTEYPDFENTIGNPEFQAFAQQRPEFNMVNAYYAYQLNQAKNQIEEAKKAGYLQGEQNAIKNIQAKGNLKVFKGGTAAPSQAQPDFKGMDRHNLALEAVRAISERRAQNGG